MMIDWVWQPKDEMCTENPLPVFIYDYVLSSLLGDVLCLKKRMVYLLVRRTMSYLETSDSLLIS